MFLKLKIIIRSLSLPGAGAGDEDYGSIRAIKWRNLSARLASRVARQQPAEGSPRVRGSKDAKRGRETRTREEEQIAQVDYPDSTNLHHAAVFPIARATWPKRYLVSFDLEEISLGGAPRASSWPSFFHPLQPEIN